VDGVETPTARETNAFLTEMAKLLELPTGRRNASSDYVE
jgi:hypothetical protein